MKILSVLVLLVLSAGSRARAQELFQVTLYSPIVGKEDSIRPVSDARFMHERIAGSQLAIIDDAAHLSNLEQTEAFNQALIDFLKQLKH